MGSEGNRAGKVPAAQALGLSRPHCPSPRPFQLQPPEILAPETEPHNLGGEKPAKRMLGLCRLLIALARVSSRM